MRGAGFTSPTSTSARAVNAIMTATYWEIGRRIVEHEQQGKVRLIEEDFHRLMFEAEGV